MTHEEYLDSDDVMILSSPHDVSMFTSSPPKKKYDYQAERNVIIYSLLEIPPLDDIENQQHHRSFPNHDTPRYTSVRNDANHDNKQDDDDFDDDDVGHFPSNSCYQETKKNVMTSGACHHDIITGPPTQRPYGGSPWMDKNVVTSTCPCCQQNLDFLTTLNEPEILVTSKRSQRESYHGMMRNRSLLHHMEDDEEDYDDNDVPGSPHDTNGGDNTSDLPCVLAAGIPYQITKCLAEGWIQKKGSGSDWIGSKAWKMRYARLCLGRMLSRDEDDDDDDIIEMPLFCIYWYPHSMQPTTVIVLDSTVVMAVDHHHHHYSTQPHNTAQQRHHDAAVEDVQFLFEIRHATTKENSTLSTHRIFATGPPIRTRDDWVYHISEALLSYNKEKAAQTERKKRRRRRLEITLMDQVTTNPTMMIRNHTTSSGPTHPIQPVLPHYATEVWTKEDDGYVATTTIMTTNYHTANSATGGTTVPPNMKEAALRRYSSPPRPPPSPKFK